MPILTFLLEQCHYRHNALSMDRWLFRKRDLASHRLKRKATWREGIAEYKAYLKDMVSGKDPNPEQMQKLDEIYERLKK